MQIDDIIIDVDLETILTDLVVNLRANQIGYIQRMKPTNTHVQICCPYHNNGMENRPSMGVRRTDGLCHCFACGEVHTLPELISHCFGRDDGGFFGLNYLLKNYISVQVENRKPLVLDYTREKKVHSERTFVTEEELDKYRYTHPYWEKRKITKEWIIDLFDLGYDKETDCITMPNKDIDGNCLFVARRSTKTKYFNYPEGVKKPVYGLYEISEMIKQGIVIKEIIICESMIDALTCWQYGKYAVALNGLGTPEQFEALNKFPCRKYIIATDMDIRGLDARHKIKRALQNKIVTEYVWDMNIAKDINEMSEKYFNTLEEIF